MTGHLLGGAGSLEADITILVLRDQIAPPTTISAMTNSFGFGGTNASLIFRSPQHDAAE
jgi:3-oxoacyl-[acyl-carrier-protein] synthase II